MLLFKKKEKTCSSIDVVNSSFNKGSKNKKDLKNFVIHSTANNVKSVDWCKMAEFDKFKVKFKLDTSAQYNALPYSLATKANLSIKCFHLQSLISFSNHTMKVEGEAVAC